MLPRHLIMLVLVAGAVTPRLGAHDHVASRYEIDPSTRRTIEHLQQRLAADPADTRSLSSLGTVWLQVARLSGEHEHYVRAEQAFRPMDDARPGLAYALVGQHRFREALIAARAVGDARPDAHEVWMLLGDIHFALGNALEAEALYGRVAEASLTMQSLSRLALIHEHRGRWDDARRAMTEALDAAVLLDAPATDRAWCLTMLGEMALRHGRLDEASEHLTLAIRVFPDAHAAHARLARIDRRRGDVERVRDRLLQLVDRHALPAYWIALGDAYAATGEQGRARAWLDKAERHMLDELGHGDMGHARELVEFWLDHDGDVEQAVVLALRDLHEVRQDAGAYATAARALHAAGRTEEAIEHIAEALKRAPTDPVIQSQASKIHKDANGLNGHTADGSGGPP